MSTRPRKISFAERLYSPRPCPNRLADPGITRLDSGIDEIATFSVRQEGALHRIDRDLLEIIHSQTKSLGCRFEFLRHGCAAHQPVVSVERNAEFLLIKNLEGMLRQT